MFCVSAAPTRHDDAMEWLKNLKPEHKDLVLMPKEDRLKWQNAFVDAIQSKFEDLGGGGKVIEILRGTKPI